MVPACVAFALAQRESVIKEAHEWKGKSAAGTERRTVFWWPAWPGLYGQSDSRFQTRRPQMRKTNDGELGDWEQNSGAKRRRHRAAWHLQRHRGGRKHRNWTGARVTKARRKNVAQVEVGEAGKARPRRVWEATLASWALSRQQRAGSQELKVYTIRFGLGRLLERWHETRPVAGQSQRSIFQQLRDDV